MRYQYIKLGCAFLNGNPFICRFMPFIGLDKPLNNPFVCSKLPLVWIKGFTLIELIITMTIAGILMAVAAPSMVGFVSSNRLASQINDLNASLSIARSEAIKRSTNAGICVTAAGGTSCVASGNWANGWLVYYVCPSTDTSCVAGNNVALKTHESLSGSNTLTVPADSLVYTKNGVVSGAASDFNFTLCDPKRGKSRILTIRIPTGRPALSESTC